MRTKAILWTAMLSLALCFGACSDDDNNGTDGPIVVPDGGTDGPIVTPDGDPGAPSVVIGATLWDDISAVAKNRLQAAELAAEHITASGLLNVTIKNESPAVGDSASGDKAGENAIKLFDDDKAAAVVSMGSGIAKGILAKIGEGAYAKYPQCSNAASNPTLNAKDGKESTEFDKNDNFYRTVVHDNFQAALLAKLTDDKGWGKIAIYALDDAYGTGMRDAFLSKTIKGTVIWNELHPSGDFDAAAEKKNLDALIAASKDDTINVVIIPTQKANAVGIIKALTEGGFDAPILLPDGGRTDDVFTTAKDLKTWLDADPTKHQIIGTESDNYAGKNSKDFTDAFKAKFTDDPDAFSSPSYDCVFAFALAMLIENKFDNEGAWDGMKKLKLSARGADAVEVGIGADGFKDAAAAIKDGKTLKYEGAAGTLDWDDTGDLVSNPFRTFKPNAAADAYEIGDKFSADDLADYI